MSERYQAGIITKSPATPTGPYGDGTASGIWTLDQQLRYQQQGVWPIAGNFPNYIENVFSTYLYTGNGSSQTITNGIDLSGKGGLVWVACRSNAQGNYMTDTVRGATKQIAPFSTAAQNTESTGLTAFSSTGYTFGSKADWNYNGYIYVNWTFRKQAKFFDIVTYTGDGTTGRAISHNLGSVPGSMIVKSLSDTGSWGVYHRSLAANNVIRLNLANAANADLPYFFGDDVNSIAPTSTTFTVASGVNVSSKEYVVYLFAHDAGGFGLSGTDNVISCGSYTGNGSTTGPTVTLGYEPQWLLVKRATGGTGDWALVDNMRGFGVSTNVALEPNSASAESTATDFVGLRSTGFQIITNDTEYNASGGTYIYIAIRRGLMKTPTSGTSVFETQTPNASFSFPTFTTSWPIDMAFFRGNRSNTGNWNNGSRLTMGSNLAGTNGGLLKLNVTSAEGADASCRFDSSVGGLFYSDTNSLGYFFRRAPGFFDEVCYTGTGSNTTQTHNLGVVPELMIVKRRSATGAWQVYSSALSNTEYLVLDTTAAKATGTTRWNSTTPTSSVFSIGTDATVNASAGTYVAYLFATVAGVSKVGSYTGTGTTKQIDCGFSNGSRFVLIKRTDSTGDWYVWDSARGIVSGDDPYLLLNSIAAEVTNTDYVDTYSAGFELSSTAPAAINASGGSFIFLAIA